MSEKIDKALDKVKGFILELIERDTPMKVIKEVDKKRMVI